MYRLNCQMIVKYKNSIKFENNDINVIIDE